MLLLCCGVLSMNAQAKFEHAQTRIQEGMSEFFVRPVVAELQMLEKECQEWTFNVLPGVSLGEINMNMLENAKANAAFKAAKLAGADIILGATFYVTNNEKMKGLDVTVRDILANTSTSITMEKVSMAQMTLSGLLRCRKVHVYAPSQATRNRIKLLAISKRFK